VNVAVALGALERARELVGQLDWDRKAEELDRVQAGLKHELETARDALNYCAPEGLVDLAAVAHGFCVPAEVAKGWEDSIGLVRNDHGDTAKAAAQSIKLRSGTQRAAVLIELYMARHTVGMSDEVLQAVLGLGASSERPRRVELCRMGFVEDSGKRVPTSTGREAVVWKVTEAGAAAARKLEVQDPIPFEEVFAEPSEVRPEEAQIPDVSGAPEDLAQLRHVRW
jgi:hypothetical protein